MKTINYNNGSVTLDLNGEMLNNVRSKISMPEAYILLENGYYKFMYNNESYNNYSFATKHKGEMYAYLVGLLNF